MELMTRRVSVAATGLALAGLLAACSDVTPSGRDPEELPTYPFEETTEEPTEPTAEPTDDPSPAPIAEVAVTEEVVATELGAPWGLAELPDGDFLLTERDAARLLVVDADGEVTEVTGPGLVTLERTSTAGEGGLLGLALHPEFTQNRTIVLYRTVGVAEPYNEVLVGELSEDFELTIDSTILEIPGATTHNGGAVAFGLDGYLYIGTGDAGDPLLSQNADSLAGKILRVDLEGEAAAGNPIPGSPVWSMGHRNVQGLGWATDGTMFASEFGASDFDELNVIVPGGNYGWPVVEGMSDDDSPTDNYRDPLYTWPTADASPSGLAVTDEGVYLAGLRGERLWRVPLGEDPLPAQELLTGEYGRLRNVVVAANGDLLVLTNNTDGRGEPAEDDDQLLRFTVQPLN